MVSHSGKLRALLKAQGIHEKLGGTGIIDDPVFKPKGCTGGRQSTFRSVPEGGISSGSAMAFEGIDFGYARNQVFPKPGSNFRKHYDR